MVRDEDHGAFLDRHGDPLRNRLRALLPRLHLLPALTGELDPWAGWLVRTRFAGWSQEEIESELRTQLAIRERVLDGARVGPNTTVVDVGAGTGLLTLGAVERVPPDGTIFAVDPSVDSLDEIRRISTYGGVYYLIGEAAVLPLPDACADAVVTRSVLIHVEDLASVAGEFARVLRPGGRASLFEPVGRKSTYAADVIDWSGLGELGDRVRVESREFIEEHDPLSRFDDDVLVEFLATNGFEQVERDLEEWDTSWEVTPEAVEIRMNAIAAPGQPSTKGRWVSSFGPEAAERVLAHVKSLAGTRAETRVVTAHVTAVRT